MIILVGTHNLGFFTSMVAKFDVVSYAAVKISLSYTAIIMIMIML